MAGLVPLLVALLAGGCALTPATPPTPPTPPGASALHDGRTIDARLAFAPLFAQALAVGAPAEAAHPAQTGSAAQTASPAALASWLHGVEPPATPPSAAAPASRRTAFAARAAGTSVLIVPGLFGDCVATQSVPFGDGVVRSAADSRTAAYAAFGDLGLRSIRTVDLPGRGRVAANGAALAALIRAEAAQPGVERIVLVGYSKGVTDALQALALLHAEGGAPAALHALVSVAGLVDGSTVAEDFAALYGTLAPHDAVFGCSASDGAELLDLTHAARAESMARLALPPTLRRYAVVAHAPASEMAPLLRPLQRRLAHLDRRNDGQVLAREALLPGGCLLAEARADHWSVALPLDRHPSAAVRWLASQRPYPREALLRATLWWVIGAPDGADC